MTCDAVRRALLVAGSDELRADAGVAEHVAVCHDCRRRLALIAGGEHALAASLEMDTRLHSADAAQSVLAVVRYAERCSAPTARMGVWRSRAQAAGIALLWLIGAALVLTTIILSMLRRFSG